MAKHTSSGVKRQSFGLGIEYADRKSSGWIDALFQHRIAERRGFLADRVRASSTGVGYQFSWPSRSKLCGAASMEWKERDES